MDYYKLKKEIEMGKVRNLYLFYGEEQYFCEKIIKVLEQYAINTSFKDFNYEYMEGDSISIQRIENACETLPFMDERRMVIVKNFPYFQGGKVSKEEEKQIEYLSDYIKRMPNSTCLIFWQIEEIDRRKKLFQVIKKIGLVLDFQKLNAYALRQWINYYFKKKGKKIKKDALDFFIENSDYLSKNSTKTLIDILNEIHKIIDYVGDKEEILVEDIKKILPKRLENDIFKLVDAIGQRDKKIALKLLNDMLKEGENGLKILSMIARQFRILIQCKELKKRGYTPNEIANKLSLMPFIIKKGILQANYFEEKKLCQAIHSILDMDFKIKTGKIDDKLALEMLIYEYTN
ncbi:DNA polymerase III subunit delta [Garciella nitratireducens]|uniref:DNA polymerase III subunit delta n=1 Tax=Garciella nitratireducens DSM 15102 TaxID=1121911 RepID=A0A1T4PVR3_9FIRM|nr:DNA polymerase III subunit delta [Garciella nitratireducens]SJZ95612.1 DNA polymerase III, delta subunit [Garciella nitratireducens DSM 15102]